ASDSAPAANSVASVTVDGGNLWIPVSACQFDTTGGNTARVFVLAEGQLHETIIQVGRRESGQVEVLAGLRAGQTIAGDGLERLRNGQRVRS
ncbi:MAG: hypothetical protein FWC56_01980, partial [Phycisphaerae bacterium]|nr:hypothetical protein [Phycisphaerae bacterium]